MSVFNDCKPIGFLISNSAHLQCHLHLSNLFDWLFFRPLIKRMYNFVLNILLHLDVTLFKIFQIVVELQRLQKDDLLGRLIQVGLHGLAWLPPCAALR